MLSAKQQPFCPGEGELTTDQHLIKTLQTLDRFINMSSVCCQAITWTNADFYYAIGPSGTNFNEIQYFLMEEN